MKLIHWYLFNSAGINLKFLFKNLLITLQATGTIFTNVDKKMVSDYLIQVMFGQHKNVKKSRESKPLVRAGITCRVCSLILSAVV